MESIYSINLMNHLSVRHSSDFYTNCHTFNRIYILNFFENVHTISVRYGKFPLFALNISKNKMRLIQFFLISGQRLFNTFIIEIK